MPILTAEERVGTTVGGRYRLESILGSGGTSTVYRARHTFTNRHVAVKLLKPEHARDRGLVARFLKEARVASTVVHPHVVTILDMGTDDGSTYLAMELVAGESLAARLGRVGALSPAEAVQLLRPLMEAVAVAHEKGIVHRDIKPENVLVGDRGDGVERAVLLDFGMAKTTESAWGHMTQSGVLVGTPYYMSPEQAEGAPDLGPPTDVWSMGVLLYRALAGDLPFTGATPTALLLCIARGDHVSLEARAPALDPAIAAWVEGALATDRKDRYADMRAMLVALDEALAGTVRARAPAPRVSASTSGVQAIRVEAAANGPAPGEATASAASSRAAGDVLTPAASRRPLRLAGAVVLVALALLGVALAVGGSDEGAAASPRGGPAAVASSAARAPGVAEGASPLGGGASGPSAPAAPTEAATGETAAPPSASEAAGAGAPAPSGPGAAAGGPAADAVRAADPAREATPGGARAGHGRDRGARGRGEVRGAGSDGRDTSGETGARGGGGGSGLVTEW